MPIKKAGFLKTTLIDYPGIIACTIFLPGCNLRCPFCHNRDLVDIANSNDETLLPVDEIISYIYKRKNILQGVCISGGEPFIHEDLNELVKEIRKAGLKIKIDTNGLLPKKLSSCSPDYIAMDIKTAPEKYSLLTGSLPFSDRISENVRESVRLLIKSSIDHEFRTTLVPGIVDESEMEIIADMAKGCRKYTLNRFNPVNTLDSKFTEVIPYTEEKYQALAGILIKKGINAVFRGF